MLSPFMYNNVLIFCAHVSSHWCCGYKSCTHFVHLFPNLVVNIRHLIVFENVSEARFLSILSTK